MKNRKLFFGLGMAFVAILAVATVSCNKKFDEPPVYQAPDITPDLTIADLKAMHTSGKFEQITDDKTIGGVVIADDQSGQFYKTIVIQDETGGIAINIDAYDLYTKYPIGRKVYVKVKGLYLGDYNKLVQLGYGVDNSGTPASLQDIPSAVMDNFLIKGTLNNTVTPKVVNVADLDNIKDQNTLIQLDNFEFAAADTAKTLADPTLGSSAINFTLKSCSGESIVLRNSSYADFAGISVPNGNGYVIAVFTVFGSTKQLNIRDTSDLKLYDARCGGGGNGSFITISDLRKLYTGTDVTLGSYKVGGIVISDAANKNVSSGSIILQNGNAGVQLYFGSSAATTNFHVGDSINVDITGGTLKKFNGSMEVVLTSSALPASAVATGKTVTPVELTIADFNSQLSNIEYTLVKIKDATASGGTFSGNKTLTDASGTTTLYTASGATFSGDALPADAKTWVGYGSFYNTTKEFQIRNTSDITDGTGGGGGGGGGTADLIFSEYVEGSSNNKYIEIYNAGSATADLSQYVVRLYANGAVSPTNSVELDTVGAGSTLAAGGIIVLKNSGAVLTLNAGVTAYASNVCNFNGDDALTIEKNATVIDVFGTVGVDPGTSWTIAGNTSAAVDKTVRRKSSVTTGNTDWTTSSANEWDVITTTDDVSGLGTR